MRWRETQQQDEFTMHAGVLHDCRVTIWTCRGSGDSLGQQYTWQKAGPYWKHGEGLALKLNMQPRCCSGEQDCQCFQVMPLNGRAD